ncbi:MAG: flagellar motor switch phosphatase FliY, partial [Candidatus Atribacteria bacterium]|nr:flagellar motor switch phosphatase FliY [Candidatus Atribacteria bacterium]
EEKDVIGELGNISMASAATALSGLLRKRVEITVPEVELVNLEEAETLFPERHLLVKVVYREGFEGDNVLLVKEEDARIMVNLMMGGDGKEGLPETLGELEASAIGEAMNQMMGSASTAMSEFLNLRISISPPEVFFEEVERLEEEWLQKQEKYVVKVMCRLVVEDVVDSYMIQLLPLYFVREITSALLPPSIEELPEEKSEEEEEKVPVSRVEKDQEEKPRKKVEARPVEFAEFRKKEEPSSQVNLELLLDVTLPLVVELGRVRLSIQEILELGPGSIVELDKLAGEPADLYVNDVLFARGEVVVIEENFGIRITEIVNPEERIKSLKEARV